jgi:hypothetical protein
LPDHAGAQHQAVRDDFGFARILFEYGQEIARQPHFASVKKAMMIAPESADHAKRMYALHSHFMTEWKPGETRPRPGPWVKSLPAAQRLSVWQAVLAVELCIAAHL